MIGIHTRLGPALSLVFVCLLAACDSGTKATGPASTQAKTVAKPTYAGEVQKLNDAITHGLALRARQPNDNLVPLEVVSLYQERARLTGSYDDYAKAEA